MQWGDVVPVGPTSDGWDETAVQTSYQLIADGLRELAGFRVATISIVEGEELVIVAISAAEAEMGTSRGEEEVPVLGRLGLRWPVRQLADLVTKAEDWGRFKYLARADLAAELGGAWWVPNIAATEDPDAWHPLSTLTAPIYGPTGALIGALTVDLPDDGHVPGPARRMLLERYADHATRTVVNAIERSRLAESARLARSAREVVRRAAANPTLNGVLDEAGATLMGSFRLVGLLARVFDGDDPGLTRSFSERPFVLSDELIAIARRSAAWLWQRGEAAIVGVTQSRNSLVMSLDRDLAIRTLEENRLDSLLFVPLGAGEECLGSLTLLREQGAPPWTDAEYQTALDIGRDLGAVLRRARGREREQRLIEELSAIDDYQSGLISTVAAQLRDPLSVIERSLAELDAPATELDHRAVDGIHRGAQRMSRVVDDLLLLSRLAHPDSTPENERVDLKAMVRRVTDLIAATADRRGLAVAARLPSDEVAVTGSPAELERMLANLVGNAVRYTPDGGEIVVRLRAQPDEVVLAVADTGVGIAEDERDRIFTEFVRGGSAQVSGEPGPGLGLSIARRIAERHRGRIEVDSEVGRGSTFRVSLPPA